MWNGQQVVAVVAAGGSGRRFGGETPKQYVAIAGTPVLVRTLGVFQASAVVDAVVVAAGAQYLAAVRTLVAGSRLTKVIDVIEGGAERQDSVWNGLERLRSLGASYVLVHDAVRPFLDEALITSVTAAAAEFGAAIPVVRPVDTVVSIDGENMVVAAQDRNILGIVQTPQAFRFGVLYEACRGARERGVRATDDASLVREAGGAVKAVPGKPLNIKITTGDDLRVAEMLATGR
jgi:2-C-methyl-D-erythritol 4-phosphate cytidylyltransferase